MSNLRSVSKKGQLNQALAVLNEIGQTLIATQDLSGVLKKIAKNARDVLRADIVDLYEYTQKNNEFSLPPILVGKRRHRHIPKVQIYNDDVVVKVVKAGKPRYFPDAQTATLLIGRFNVKRDDAPDKRFVIREGVLSSVSIPLQAGRETVGVMFVNYRTKQVFDDDQKNLIESFSNLAAIAIYNARLYKAEHDRRQLSDFQTQALDRLSRLSQRLVSIREEHENVSDLLNEVAQSAQEVLRADIIELYEYSQVKRLYELPQISVGERIGPFVPKQEIYDDDVVLQLIDRDQPSYIENSQVDESIASDYKINRADVPSERFAIRENIQSTAAIPLKAGDEPVGLMFANYRTKQEFTTEQKELIELFANQAAIAIQNARLYQDLDKKRIRQLEDVNRRLETLISFGQTLTSEIRLKEAEILNLIHRQASELMDTQNMYVALYDEKADMIKFGLAFQNGKPIAIEPRKIDNTQRGRTEEIIRTKESIFLPTEKESEDWYNKPGRQKFVSPALPSWIGVPMMVEDKVLGVIATYHPTKDNVYNQDDVEILHGIADQAAIAIDNARHYNEVNAGLITKTSELERLNAEKDEELQASRQKISQAEQMIVINSFTMDILHRVPNLVGTIPLRVDTIIQRLNEISTKAEKERAVGQVNSIKRSEVERVIGQVEGIRRDAEILLDSVKKWNPYEEALKKFPEDVALLLNSALRNALIPDNVEIEIDFAEELPCVLCNPKELFESFRCLIENSFQAMVGSQLGRLLIRTSLNTTQEQKWIDIRIMDTGQGIAPENLPKVFELGFTTKNNGMGYGLWRARAVIEKIGGEISVTSFVNKGTTFDIRLPGAEGEICND